MAAPIQQSDYRIVYVEKPSEPSPKVSPTIEKIRLIAGTIFSLLGLIVFLGATVALAGHLLGCFVVPLETVHTFFMTGVVSALGGFHLLKGGSSSSAEISAGPVAVQI